MLRNMFSVFTTIKRSQEFEPKSFWESSFPMATRDTDWHLIVWTPESDRKNQRFSLGKGLRKELLSASGVFFNFV